MKASRGLVEFIYDGDQLVKIDTYRTSGGSPVLERRLMIYYAGAEVNKIEQYLSPNGVPFLSSFITYSYNGEGKMIQKNPTSSNPEDRYKFKSRIILMMYPEIS